MRTVALALITLAALTALASAQVTSPPPICFQFNDPATAASLSWGYTNCASPIVVHFAAPTTSTVDRIDLWQQYGCGPFCLFVNTVIELYPTSGIGTPPTAPFLTTFSANLTVAYPMWVPFLASASATLAAGGTYALRIQTFPAIPNIGNCNLYSCYPLGYDPLGAAQLPYHYGPNTPTCLAGFPPSGSIGLMLRFRGVTCGPGPPAMAVVYPSACGASPGSFATLSILAPPVLGSTIPMTVNGPIGGTAMLFWGAWNQTPVPVAPGSGCYTYLNLNSVAMLAAAGAEPLVAGVLVPPGPGLSYGLVNWGFPITGNPFYAGFVLGIQVAVVGPTGTIPIGGGQFFQTTDAWHLTLGY